MLNETCKFILGTKEYFDQDEKPTVHLKTTASYVFIVISENTVKGIKVIGFENNFSYHVEQRSSTKVKIHSQQETGEEMNSSNSVLL